MMEKLPRLERGQALVQHSALAGLGQGRGQHLGIHCIARNRGQGQHAPRRLGQRVHARQDEALYRAGQAGRCCGPARLNCVRGFSCRQRQFAEKERVPAGPIQDRLRQFGRNGLGRKQGSQHAGALIFTQAGQPQEAVILPVPPGRLPGGLGAKQCDEQHGQPLEAAGQLVEHVKAGIIRPMQVVQHDDQRLAGSARQEPAEQVHDPPLPGPRLDLGPRKFARHGRREDLGQDGHVLGPTEPGTVFAQRPTEGRGQMAIRLRPPQRRRETQQAAQQPGDQLVRTGAVG